MLNLCEMNINIHLLLEEWTGLVVSINTNSPKVRNIALNLNIGWLLV